MNNKHENFKFSPINFKLNSVLFYDIDLGCVTIVLYYRRGKSKCFSKLSKIIRRIGYYIISKTVHFHNSLPVKFS